MSLPANLVQGYNRFKSGTYIRDKDRYIQFSREGQPAKTLVIACCDSRSSPEIIFDAKPGEIFVIRNVANLVPPFQPDGNYHGTSAALEFAVMSLKVSDIVVMGHGRCAGINSVLTGATEPLTSSNFLGKWLELLREPAMRIKKDRNLDPALHQTALERAAIAHSISYLRTFPMIKAAEQNKQIAIHGAWFDIASGELWTLKPENGQFVQCEHNEKSTGALL